MTRAEEDKVVASYTPNKKVAYVVMSMFTKKDGKRSLEWLFYCETEEEATLTCRSLNRLYNKAQSEEARAKAPYHFINRLADCLPAADLAQMVNGTKKRLCAFTERNGAIKAFLR